MTIIKLENVWMVLLCYRGCGGTSVTCVGVCACPVTRSVCAALSAWGGLLPPGQVVGGPRSPQIGGGGSLSLGQVQRSRSVTQTVPVATIFIHQAGLGLLVNGSGCGDHAA